MDPVSDADDVPVDEPGAPTGDGEPIVPGSLGPHPERHPDDLPPGEPERRRVPAGILWAIALGLVVLAIASWVALSSESKTADDVVRLTDPNATVPAAGLGGFDPTGQPASATTYTTFGGGSTSVAGHAGTPVVLNFWASFCAPCITEMPALEQVHQQVGDDVTFVGLAVTDREDAARGLAARTGVSYELGFDPNGQIIGESGGTVLPTTVFIDADGTVVDIHTGQIDAAELREKIRTNFGVDPAGS
jgi:thiol-disulfide isomerase/thioredoxin